MTETRDELIAEHRQGGEYVTVEDTNIFYRTAGPDQGTPLVLTHGIPRSSFLYRKMIPILAEHNPVRAWDLYGFGLSDKPKEGKRYRFEEFERFLGRFIDTLGLDRFHLICHDVGGPFSIGYAVRNPDRIASLTILNTTVFLKDFHIPGPVLTAILTPMVVHKLLVSDGRTADFLLRYIQKNALFNPTALSGIEGEAFKELLFRDEGMLTLARTLKAYRVVVPYLLGIQRALEGFTRPTLILWGKHDPFCPLPIAAQFRKHIRDSRLEVIENASHFLQEDCPEEVANMILGFTKDCS